MTIEELINRLDELAKEGEAQSQNSRRKHAQLYYFGIRDAYNWATKLAKEVENN